MQKYDTHDARNILERASARETAARTVVGYVAKQLLASVGVAVLSHVVESATAQSDVGVVPIPTDLAGIDDSPVRAPQRAGSHDQRNRTGEGRPGHARRSGRSCRSRSTRRDRVAYALGSAPRRPSRIRSYVDPGDQRCGIGDGFESARRRGSAAHDEIYREDDEFVRKDRPGRRASKVA